MEPSDLTRLGKYFAPNWAVIGSRTPPAPSMGNAQMRKSLSHHATSTRVEQFFRTFAPNYFVLAQGLVGINGGIAFGKRLVVRVHGIVGLRKITQEYCTFRIGKSFDYLVVVWIMYVNVYQSQIDFVDLKVNDQDVTTGDL